MTAMTTLIVALSRQVSGTRTVEEVDELGLALNALATTDRVSQSQLVRVGEELEARRAFIIRVNNPPVIDETTRYSILVPRNGLGGGGWDFYKRGQPMLWEECRAARDDLRAKGNTNIKIVLVTSE